MSLRPQSPVRAALAAAGLALTFAFSAAACLEAEQVTHYRRECSCSGVRCINDMVMRSVPSRDEEADPCLACHYEQLGRCAEGCGTAPREVEGCQVAQSCKSWDRVAVGAECGSNLDCEPGAVDGAPARTLVCESGHCVDAGERKWEGDVRPARECTGDPFYGPHPDCAGAACLAPEPYGQKRYCSVARCLDNSDCPTGWRCRCQEQTSRDGLKAHRWCVPDIGGTFPPEAVIPLEPPAAE